MSQKRRTTLEDVARIANVSAVTVSRALRRPDMVSPELRKRIDAAVDRLAYVPNFAASRLASTRTHSIGIVVSSLSNGIFADYLQAIYDALLPLGFRPVVVSSRYSAEEEEGAIRTLLGQNIEALILVGVNQTRAARRILERSRIPVVQTFELTDDPIDLNVGLSQRQGGHAATRFLIELGHRRIAYLSGQRDDRARARLEGYHAALAEAGLDGASLVAWLPAQATISLGRKLTEEMLASEAPDAIFCCDDNIALGALFACQQAGLEVPRRISLIGFNDLEFAAASNPPLSTVLTPRADMGRVASELVLQVIATGKRPRTRRIDLGFEIVARGSTGPHLVAS
ncbi:LacI family DNA-binding transcriptional regulator [Bradyrhizobium sp. HKCCYLS2058]|uniref:LacI family DNA-binding transcriptional regulator n=1 Tax=unclassified Bradyrhizobium TaxID=2631580 RepID=UPI003EBF70F3